MCSAEHGSKPPAGRPNNDQWQPCEQATNCIGRKPHTGSTYRMHLCRNNSGSNTGPQLTKKWRAGVALHQQHM
jgi:hypothetical protein